MSEKLNLSIHLNAYSDDSDSNSPTLNNFRWNREYLSLDVGEPSSKVVNLAPNETLSLFSGSINISADTTTKYDILLKSGSSSVYQILHSGGTEPYFRTPRISGADATTMVSVTKNAKVLKFESTGGTLFDLITGAVVVGDRVRVGDNFNPSNRGEYKIIALTATSFSVENETGVVESNIVLGTDFADQVNIYSASGVQIGDKIDIQNNFSLVTQGTYEIIDVSHNYVEFHCVSSLPEETNISNDPDAFVIYRSAKQMVYMESDKKINIKINSTSITNTIEPFEMSGNVKPGVFLSKSTIKSIEVSNPTTETCKLYYITVE